VSFCVTKGYVCGDRCYVIAMARTAPQQSDGFADVPFVKELRVEQLSDLSGWFAPQAFVHDDLRYFSAFVSVHTLKLQRLEIYRFTPFIERYLGHFSPTLRSIKLSKPSCTSRQLSHFLSLFSNLDDVEIEQTATSVYNTTVPIQC